ncbi:hypothetical protein BT67DRAFT_276341 [Trichocladium antarcticum]|uniref:Uncharacterized protein n=1 Tax=Trichocladium antarcticum TaxID=1450529 RepID=A0AAN6ZDV2_9PEZI|nr:hypothetical protein BT67DRAFT_276341 [Trichocladium antarcticum]
MGLPPPQDGQGMTVTKSPTPAAALRGKWSVARIHPDWPWRPRENIYMYISKQPGYETRHNPRPDQLKNIINLCVGRALRGYLCHRKPRQTNYSQGNPKNSRPIHPSILREVLSPLSPRWPPYLVQEAEQMGQDKTRPAKTQAWKAANSISNKVSETKRRREKGKKEKRDKDRRHEAIK